MFPSTYLIRILDEGREADLLRQLNGRPGSGREVVKSGRAALIRLLGRDTR